MKKWMMSICILMAVGVNASAHSAESRIQTGQTQAEAEQDQEQNQDKRDDAGMQKVNAVQNTRDNEQKKDSTVLKRMFRFHKKLYIETGETSSAARCGVMDGQITSSVAADKMPKKNGQSNFGSGYGIQYGSRKNRMEVCIDDVWYVFAYNENNFEGVSMQVVKNTSAKAVIQIVNTTDLQVEYGTDFILEKQKKKSGEWTAVPMKEGWGFHDIAYYAPKDKTIKRKVNWSGSHGKLKPGTYRIVKEFMDYRGSGDYTEYVLSAEFQVKGK